MENEQASTSSDQGTGAGLPSARQNATYLRSRLRNIFESARKVDSPESNVLNSTNQLLEDIDPFEGRYVSWNLLEPPYDLAALYRIYEQSDLLQECVDAMIKNVDGFGFGLQFLGNDIKAADTPLAQANKQILEDFFNHANDTQSFTTIRKLMREDYEVVGNGALEVVRNLLGKVSFLNYLPFRYVRLSPIDQKGVTVPVLLPRNGKLVPIRMKKYFRKYAQMGVLQKKVRWFKELGDPRIMDATTGEYKRKASDCKMVATELLHFKTSFGGSTYGVPRWIGSLLDVVGRRHSQYVNYDLFENQGIPPVAILVSGGILTDESIEQLEALVRGARGVSEWNKILILESNIEAMGLDEKGTAKIELKNLTEFRKEDLMFDKYLKSTAENIRHKFRLPPLYTGATEEFTNATAKSSRLVVEEQVFVPERFEFDEVINNKIVRAELKIMDWRYVSKGPRLAGSEDINTGMDAFGKAGALTVNHSIQIANDLFGLSMSKYDQPWANYPLPIVLKLLELGRLERIEELEIDPKDMPPTGVNPLKPAGQQALPSGQPKAPLKLPPAAQKVLKSDMFTDEEKKLYRQLLFLQGMVEGRELTACEEHEHLDL